MKGLYRVTFVDGSHEDIDADDATIAKMEAKKRRTLEIDPGGKAAQAGGGAAADLARHDRIKVRGVHELDRDAATTSAAAGDPRALVRDEVRRQLADAFPPFDDHLARLVDDRVAVALKKQTLTPASGGESHPG